MTCLLCNDSGCDYCKPDEVEPVEVKDEPQSPYAEENKKILESIKKLFRKEI